MGRPRGSKNSVQRKYKDYTGEAINQLRVIRKTGLDKHGASVYECVCVCGNTKLISVGNLKRTKSCGCLRVDAALPTRTNKRCSKCKEIKPVAEFNRNKSRRDGYSQFCKSCISEIEKYHRPRQRKWRAEYQREKRRNSINFRIAGNLRRRFRDALRGRQKWTSVLNMVGCSLGDFVKYIENDLSNGMTWNNYGKYWHIDHIKPCAAFDLSDPEQQKLCFHYSNMRPLRASENVSKSSWYNGVRYRYG